MEAFQFDAIGIAVGITVVIAVVIAGGIARGIAFGVAFGIGGGIGVLRLYYYPATSFLFGQGFDRTGISIILWPGTIYVECHF
jgi:hypothetical protein